MSCVGSLDVVLTCAVSCQCSARELPSPIRLTSFKHVSNASIDEASRPAGRGWLDGTSCGRGRGRCAYTVHAVHRAVQILHDMGTCLHAHAAATRRCHGRCTVHLHAAAARLQVHVLEPRMHVQRCTVCTTVKVVRQQLSSNVESPRIFRHYHYTLYLYSSLGRRWSRALAYCTKVQTTSVLSCCVYIKLVFTVKYLIIHSCTPTVNRDALCHCRAYRRLPRPETHVVTGVRVGYTTS